MLSALALGALSAGGSLLSGIGASQASAKQARLQVIADGQARVHNEVMLGRVNEARRILGRELLDIPETHEVSTSNRSWVDVDAMMAAAERSGFNPVTWLNAGGMQAYTQTDSHNRTVSTGHNAADAFKIMVPEYALATASQVPQQHSMLSAFGGALSAGANAFGTQYRADMSYDLQAQRLASMAMGNVNQGMGLSQGNGLMTALLASGSGGVGGTSSAGGLSPSRKADDVYWPGYEQPGSHLWENKKPESTNPLPPNWGWSIPPGYANAESYEDTFGELVSMPYGVWKLGNTALHNLTGATLPAGLTNWWNGAKWDGQVSNGFSGSVKPYTPFSGSYPAWAVP